MKNDQKFKGLGLIPTVLVFGLSSIGLIQGAFAAPTIKIGIILPMSGGTATFGAETMNGMRLAIEEVNQGKELKVESVLEDDKSDVSDAANAAKKLINVDKANILVGSVASSNTNAMAPIAQSAGIPLLTPTSTNVNVTQKGDFISRICFIDDFQGLAMAKFAFESLGKKTAALVVDSSSDYSIGLAGAFKQAFTKLGGTIVTEVMYVAKDQDFSSQLTRIRTKKPEVVFAPGYYQEVGTMLRQARTLGVKAIFMGGDGWSSPKLFELAGESVAGNYFADHFSPEDSDPKVKEFVAKFKAKYKEEPSAMSALGYDAVYVIADAVKRAGGKVDPLSLKKAINTTKGFRGITGAITLDANRNATKPLVILETRVGSATFKQRVAP